MADDRIWFTAAAGAKIAAAVRRLEAIYGNLDTPGKAPRFFDSERFIDGVASNDCNVDGYGTMTPSEAGADDQTYWNPAPMSYVKSGSKITIAFSNRSGTIAARDHSSKSTNWVRIDNAPPLRCALTATLSHNSSAAATITKYDESAGSSITVYDPGLIGSGYHFASGVKLQVYYNVASGHYEWLAGPCRVAD